jgi:hypothetical protein
VTAFLEVWKNVDLSGTSRPKLVRLASIMLNNQRIDAIQKASKQPPTPIMRAVFEGYATHWPDMYVRLLSRDYTAQHPVHHCQ